MKKILWVMPDFPFPPNHGGRFDVHRRLLEVAKADFNIHLVATVKMEPSRADLEEANSFVSRVDTVQRIAGLLAPLRRLPHQVASRSLLAKLKLDPYYDLLIMESEYVSEILNNRSTSFGKIALRVHNDESVYYRNLAKSIPFGFRKCYYWHEILWFQKFSNRIKKRADISWYISDKEAIQDSDFYNKVVHVPTPFNPAISLDGIMTLSSRNLGQQVLFVGSLFMVNNIEGLRWYIDNVHESLFGLPFYSLIVAGNCNGVDQAVLDYISSTDRLIFYKTPDSLDSIYAEAAVFVNPMLHGAGVKMKTINAIEYGLPVVSTTIGLEGLDLREGVDVLKGDDPKIFSRHVFNLLNDPDYAFELARTAQAQCRNTASFLPHVLNVLKFY